MDYQLPINPGNQREPEPGGGSPPPARDRPRALVADAALLSVAIVWGLNFVVIKDAIADTGPMTYLLWRHVLAAIMLAVLALTQIVAAAVPFIIVTPFTEHITWGFGWQGWAAIVWTALSGTVFGFLIQAWAQKSTTSTRAAVILGLEGLFAAVFGLLFGMDVLSWRFVAGAALILAGVIVIETLPSRRDGPNPADVLPSAD